VLHYSIDTLTGSCTSPQRYENFCLRQNAFPQPPNAASVPVPRLCKNLRHPYLDYKRKQTKMQLPGRHFSGNIHADTFIFFPPDILVHNDAWDIRIPALRFGKSHQKVRFNIQANIRPAFRMNYLTPKSGI
jgi:hypothetical protein